nr:MAG TPA: hypothetical protein [Caudoviricetes sp.]
MGGTETNCWKTGVFGNRTKVDTPMIPPGDASRSQVGFQSGAGLYRL